MNTVRIALIALAALGCATALAQDIESQIDEVFADYTQDGSPGAAVAVSTANDDTTDGVVKVSVDGNLACVGATRNGRTADHRGHGRRTTPALLDVAW